MESRFKTIEDFLVAYNNHPVELSIIEENVLGDIEYAVTYKSFILGESHLINRYILNKEEAQSVTHTKENIFFDVKTEKGWDCLNVVSIVAVEPINTDNNYGMTFESVQFDCQQGLTDDQLEDLLDSLSSYTDSMFTDLYHMIGAAKLNTNSELV